MPETTLDHPQRLAVFAIETATGLPISRMPLYVEVIVRSEREEIPVDIEPDDRLDAIVIRALRKDAAQNLAEPQPRERLLGILKQEIVRQVGARTNDLLQAEGFPEFVAATIRRVRGHLGGIPLRDVEPGRLKTVLREAIRAEAPNHKVPLLPPVQPTPTLWAYPLGVLGTDHAGYLSYDLTRLPLTVRHAVATAAATRRLDPSAALDVTIALYPGGPGGAFVDALAQGRLTSQAIVARLELTRPLLPDDVRNLGLPAMQTPSLQDWRLSPGSFATNPSTLVGADGCESILPANVALHEYHFYQVVHLTDVAPPVSPVKPGQLQLGVVNEYRVAWNPLGHSLGQVIYSLPLAPGESVNLAVIDWTRRDEAQRKERTTVDEQLVHNEHRDRTISETVSVAAREYQHGSSFMAGIGGAVSGSYAGVSGGLAGSLGGSTSSSSGNRDVTGATVQKLSDNITQASSAARELQSTVVVHSTQSESETIETRTIVNYNHSHALTILYYEVLRHFRVATELTRQRPAVLVQFRTDWFDGDGAMRNILEHRRPLGDALLDARLSGGFDALERVANGPFADLTKPLPSAPTLAAEPNPPPLFHYFRFEIRTGGLVRDVNSNDQQVDVLASLLLTDGTELPLLNSVGNNVINHNGTFRFADQDNVFTAVPQGNGTVSWSKIMGIGLAVAVFPTDDDAAKVSFSHIKVFGIDLSGPDGVAIVDEPHELGHVVIRNGDLEQGKRLTLPTRRPPPPLAPPPPFSASDASDRQLSVALIAHLRSRKRVYGRAIALSLDIYDRSDELESIKLSDGSNALQHLDVRPLEAIGDYLAYASTDPAWSALIDARIETGHDRAAAPAEALDERLVTLPTRGVFAEAKLGHCNASERIDPTRFWDWQKSPIPHFAPEIAPATPVTPQPQQLNLSPTPFPNSIVNIVNPPNAPDPAGLASAFKVLGTPNLFRDMSGLQEVTQLLQTLANDATALATKLGGPGGAASPKPSGGGPGGGAPASASGAAGGAAAGPGASPGTPRSVSEVNSLASGIREQLPPDMADPLVDRLYQDVVERVRSDSKAGLINDPSQISGEFFLSSTGAGFPTGPDHLCFPVSEFQTPNFASGFGTIAERMIEDDYCNTFACSTATTFKDNNNPTEFRDFLKSHNPSLMVPATAAKFDARFPGVSRPDILCDDGVRRDYYEIKPFSISGVAEGLAKRILIHTFMGEFKLPYVAGVTYSPSKDLPIMSGTVLGSRIGVSLNVQRHIEGIVTYTICLTGAVTELLLKATLAAVLAYIAAVMLPMLLAPAAVA